MINKACIALLAIAGCAAAIPVDTFTVKGADSAVSYLARPAIKDAIKRPALVLAPEWWGLNGYAQRRARELAALGYVVLAVDFYGNRKLATDRSEAGKLAGGFYGDPSRFRKVLTAALAQLKARADVDSTKIGALGFCFGGTAVLEAARAGLPLVAAASFHGSVKPFAPTVKGAVKGRVLVLHGGADPNVTMESVTEFVKDFEAAGADYGVEVYARAVHAFTNPDAGNDPSKGAAYNAAAEKASFEAFHRLLAQTGLKP